MKRKASKRCIKKLARNPVLLRYLENELGLGKEPAEPKSKANFPVQGNR